MPMSMLRIRKGEPTKLSGIRDVSSSCPTRARSSGFEPLVGPPMLASKDLMRGTVHLANRGGECAISRKDGEASESEERSYDFDMRP